MLAVNYPLKPLQRRNCEPEPAVRLIKHHILAVTALIITNKGRDVKTATFENCSDLIFEQQYRSKNTV